jgi:large subunit ribosomal protein L37Ae
MSSRKKKTSFGHRLRSRGGASVQKRWSRIVSNMRKDHKCPSCAMPHVTRVSVGLWECEKCGYKFAGGAYQPQTRTGQTSQRLRQQQ